MGKSRLLSLLIYLLLKLISLPPLVVSLSTCCSGPCTAISYCNGPCGDRGDSNEYKNHNYSCNGSSDFINYECIDGLICRDGKCKPESGTNTCQETTPSLQSGGCKKSGTLKCKGCEQSNKDPLCEKGKPYDTYECSPTVTSSTPANLTYNEFNEGGDGGDPSSCGNRYLSNNQSIVALSTGWYNNGTRCNKTIHIQVNNKSVKPSKKNNNSVKAMVVDECSSMLGCDKEHAGQRPCENNIVDGSDAVWKALGLDKGENGGKVEITWYIIE